MKGISKKSIRNALAVLLCVVTVMLSFCSCSSDKNAEKEAEGNNAAAETIGSGKQLSLADYVKVTYSAMDATVENLYSGYAKPVIEVDYDKLGKDIGIKGYKNYHIEVEGHDKKRVDSYFEGSDHVSAINYFKIDFKDYYEYVANGDVITVELSVKSNSYTLEETVSAMNISIEKELNITVEGLKQAKELDFMGEIEKYVVYTGANGNGKAKMDFSSVTEPFVVDGVFYLKPENEYNGTNSVKVVYENEEIATFGYYIEKERINNSGMHSYRAEEITEGDVLYIKILDSKLSSELIKRGYVLKETVREFTVPDIGDYVKAKDEMTSEDIEKIKQDFSNELSVKYPDSEILSMHFATIKPGEACEVHEKTEIFFVCKINYSWGSSYHCYSANSIVKTKAGEIRYEGSDMEAIGKTPEEVEGRFDPAYTYEKLF